MSTILSVKVYFTFGHRLSSMHYAPLYNVRCVIHMIKVCFKSYGIQYNTKIFCVTWINVIMMHLYIWLEIARCNILKR